MNKRFVAVISLLVVGVLIITWASIGSSPPRARPPRARGHHMAMEATMPTDGAVGVPADTTVSLTYPPSTSRPVPIPTLSPPVKGRWKRTGEDTVTFHPGAPFVPGISESVNVGTHSAIEFTVAEGSTTRLEQLLALLGYLPLAFAPPRHTKPAELAETQAGKLVWRWTNVPPSLSSMWTPGVYSEITKAAVSTFESENNLTVDGLAGPRVWGALLAAAVSGHGDGQPYTYVDVTKTLPEHLTLFVDGTRKYGDVPVNTGAPGANTPDGSFIVYEHVRASTMKGTNVTGSTYDDPTVPWASYFTDGDALHGFPRAHYGFPQSNGCVEMAISTAAKIWPFSTVGTIVTIAGPPPAGTPPPTTTSTTAPSLATTPPATNPPPPPATGTTSTT